MPLFSININREGTVNHNWAQGHKTDVKNANANFSVFLNYLGTDNLCEHCMLFLHRFMYLIFKSNGCSKYGCGLLETVIQTQVLPGDLSQRLIWNRFHNSYNRVDTNIPLDLKVSRKRAQPDHSNTYSVVKFCFTAISCFHSSFHC